jgi:hypothetical protein
MLTTSPWDGNERASPIMMRSHFFLMVLFAFFVSLVFAVIAKDDAVAQIRLGSLMFAGFLVSAVVLGWLMFPFPF